VLVLVVVRVGQAQRKHTLGIRSEQALTMKAGTDLTPPTPAAAAAAHRHHHQQPSELCTLGDVWNSGDELADIRSISINDSDDNGNTELALCFRNQCDTTLLLCWIDEDGQPHHFYRLEPSRIETGRVVVTVEDWVEQTQLVQAFVLAFCSDEHAMKQKQAIQKQSLEGTILVGGYRPRILQQPPSSPQHQAEKDDHSSHNDEDEDVLPVHIIEIFPRRETGGSQSSTNLRGASTVPRKDTNNNYNGGPPTDWYLHVTLGEIDPTPIDTTGKPYTAATLGGWPVLLDPDWESAPQHYRELLERDLQQLCRILPYHAVESLQANNTPCG